MNICASVGAVLLVFGMEVGAEAACDILQTEPLESVALTYDPFELQVPQATFRLVLENQAEARDLEIIISGTASPDLPLQGPGEALALDIDERTNVEPVAGTGGQHFILRAAPQTTTIAQFDVGIAGEPVPAPGLYSDDIVIQLKDRLTGEACVERLRLGAQVLVPSRAQVNFAGTSGPMGSLPGLNHVDFGALETGAQREVFVQIRANGAATIRLSSENDGVLLHRTLPEFAAPYSLEFLGGAVDLSGPNEFPAPAAKSIAGVSLPLKIIIGEVGGLPSGIYEDLLHVEISAL